MENRESVENGEKKGRGISNRTLKLPGLKPTDYFLFTQIRDYFGLPGLRGVLVFGLRWIYSSWHDKELREKMRVIARSVLEEDLDKHIEIKYKDFDKI